jgi:hypothetical protein
MVFMPGDADLKILLMDRQAVLMAIRPLKAKEKYECLYFSSFENSGSN